MKRTPARPRKQSVGSSRDGVVVFGEVLCDLFAPAAGVPIATAPHLVPRLGGAPANVAVQLARLGVSTRLITATGKDPFGERLTSLLRGEGVDVSGVVVKAGRRTGCTLVEVADNGDRSFFGFRENSADLALDVDDLGVAGSVAALKKTAVVHTGTVSLRSASARRATRALQLRARDVGCLVSLDVNLRPGMFPSLPLLLRLATAAAGRADVVKATREEAAALCDAHSGKRRRSDDALVDWLLSRGARLALLTLGEEGCVVATRRRRIRLRPLGDTVVVDVTGAGDAFVGAALAWLSARGLARDDLDDLDDGALTDLGDRAGVCGAAAVTALGATTHMLARADVDARLKAFA